jgi:ureidoacrylate peracid hydrolase
MPAAVPTADTALLMIDLQNAFLDPTGWAARLRGGLAAPIRSTVGPARTALDSAHAAGIPVIYTQHSWLPDFSDAGFIVEEKYPQLFGAPLSPDVRSLVTGSWEADFFPALAPEPGDHIIHKNRYDAFLGTTLEQLLTRLGIRTLVVGGLVTVACVESTVRSAAMRDYRVFLVEDAIGDVETWHEDAMARLSAGFGHPVAAAQLAQSWRGADLPLAKLTA